MSLKFTSFFFFFYPAHQLQDVRFFFFFSIFTLDTLKSNKVFLRGILYHNFIILSFSVGYYENCHIWLRKVGRICLQDQLQKMYLAVNLSLALREGIK